MLDGVKITMGGVKMTMPPMNLRTVKPHWQAIITGNFNDPEVMYGLIFGALSRNYPELTLEEMEDKMLPGEMMNAFQQLLPISGFNKQATPGEPRRGSAKTRIGTE